ncbi:protein of unknown function [Burkholderia multivorans]
MPAGPARRGMAERDGHARGATRRAAHVAALRHFPSHTPGAGLAVSIRKHPRQSNGGRPGAHRQRFAPGVGFVPRV